MKEYKLKKWYFTALVIGMLAIITACGQGDADEAEEQQGTEPELNLEPLSVELMMDEEGDPNTEITIQALVTQGDEKVNDANEVIFEIWKQGQKEDSEFIEVEESNGDGIYEIVHVFEEEYYYMVQPHVTARGMHMMPVGEIKIGNAPEVEETDEMDDHEHHGDTGNDEGDAHEEHDGHNDHGLNHHDDLMIDWQTEADLYQSTSSELVVYIELENEPLTNGDIQFEIWQDGDERHTWLPAEEGESGHYTAFHTFERTGDYNIQIHVEDDADLHEHKQIVISVDHSH